jgi:hypothetical protein
MFTNRAYQRPENWVVVMNVLEMLHNRITTPRGVWIPIADYMRESEKRIRSGAHSTPAVPPRLIGLPTLISSNTHSVNTAVSLPTGQSTALAPSFGRPQTRRIISAAETPRTKRDSQASQTCSFCGAGLQSGHARANNCPELKRIGNELKRNNTTTFLPSLVHALEPLPVRRVLH